MTIELVDGKAGTAHISSEDKDHPSGQVLEVRCGVRLGRRVQMFDEFVQQGDDRHRLRVDTGFGLAYHGGGIGDDLQRVTGHETQ